MSLVLSLSCSDFGWTGSRTCPKGLNPAQAIAKIKMELAAD
jgi:succinate dehydrogenase/fumarate reductase-like Fe-S protein